MRGLCDKTLGIHARWRAAGVLGRPLATGELVHHKNGNRHDNRAQNLQVMTRGGHTRLHREQGDLHVFTPEEARRGVHIFTAEERRRGQRERYSDDQVLDGIRRAAKRSTRSRLSTKEYDRLRGPGSACACACKRRFGLWNRAKGMAGVQ